MRKKSCKFLLSYFLISFSKQVCLKFLFDFIFNTFFSSFSIPALFDECFRILKPNKAVEAASNQSNFRQDFNIFHFILQSREEILFLTKISPLTVGQSKICSSHFRNATATLMTSCALLTTPLLFIETIEFVHRTLLRRESLLEKKSSFKLIMRKSYKKGSISIPLDHPNASKCKKNSNKINASK